MAQNIKKYNIVNSFMFIYLKNEALEKMMCQQIFSFLLMEN